MSFVDPIGDMITRIRNAQLRALNNVKIPSSKFRAKILDILKQEGYISDYKFLSNSNNKGSLSIDLKYNNGLPVIKEIKRLHREEEDNEEQISQYGEELTAFINTYKLDYEKLQMGYTNARTTATPTRMDEIKKFIFNESRNNKFKEDWRDKNTLDELVAQNRAVKNNVLKFRRQLNETVSKEGGMDSFQMYMPPGSLNDNGTVYKAEKAKVNESVRKARKKKEKKPKTKKTRFKSVKRFAKKIWTRADAFNSSDTIFIFVKNKYPDEIIVGENDFQHIECLRVKKIKLAE